MKNLYFRKKIQDYKISLIKNAISTQISKENLLDYNHFLLVKF